MTTKVNCPDAFTEDEPDDATLCDRCSFTSIPSEFVHVGDLDYCLECFAKIRRENLRILPKNGTRSI